MSQWVQSYWRFDEGAAIFYVTHKHMAMESSILSLLADNRDPVRLESAVRDLLGKYRPKLAEASIYSMQYNHSFARWEFAVSHPSLPRLQMGERMQDFPLDPAYERDMQAST
jgi:hypothetical protein